MSWVLVTQLEKLRHGGIQCHVWHQIGRLLVEGHRETPCLFLRSFNHETVLVFDDLAAITLQFAAVYYNCNYTTGLCQSPGTLRVSSD